MSCNFFEIDKNIYNHRKRNYKIGDRISYYVTFGQQYRNLRHPFWQGCHPDGLLLIESAPLKEGFSLTSEYHLLILTVRSIFGNAYCNIIETSMCSDEEINDMLKHYPCGILKHIKLDEPYEFN